MFVVGVDDRDVLRLVNRYMEVMYLERHHYFRNQCVREDRSVLDSVYVVRGFRFGGNASWSFVRDGL